MTHKPAPMFEFTNEFGIGRTTFTEDDVLLVHVGDDPDEELQTITIPRHKAEAFARFILDNRER